MNNLYRKKTDRSKERAEPDTYQVRQKRGVSSLLLGTRRSLSSPKRELGGLKKKKKKKWRLPLTYDLAAQGGVEESVRQAIRLSRAYPGGKESGGSNGPCTDC